MKYNNRFKTVIIIIVLIVSISIVGVLMKKSHNELDISSISKNHEGLEQIVDWYYSEYNVPAISVAIIKNESVDYINHGLLNRNGEKKADENTFYQIASLTKTFTGIISKSLSVEGKINLNESIISYLPIELDEDSKNKLKTITINDLLFHTSGLPTKANSLDRYIFGGSVKNPYLENNLIQDLKNCELLFVPGEGWSYSNLGYALLGYILEKVTNEKYEALVSRYVSKKYNLLGTKINLNNSERKSLATPYRPEWNTIKTKDSDFGLHTSASGLYTSSKELSRLMMLQLGAYKYFDSLKVNNPLILTDKTVGSSDVSYGLGVFKNLIIKEQDTIVSIGHGGDFDGYASHYVFIPEREVGIIILTSSGGDWLWKMEKQISSKLLESL